MISHTRHGHRSGPKTGEVAEAGLCLKRRAGRSRLKSGVRLLCPRGRLGISSGLAIPIKAGQRVYIDVHLGIGESAIDFERDIDAVAAVGPPSRRRPARGTRLWLHPKETVCLKWIAVGKTMEEAADLDGASTIVRGKLNEARKRLDVYTMPRTANRNTIVLLPPQKMLPTRR